MALKYTATKEIRNVLIFIGASSKNVQNSLPGYDHTNPKKYPSKNSMALSYICSKTKTSNIINSTNSVP